MSDELELPDIFEGPDGSDTRLEVGTWSRAYAFSSPTTAAEKRHWKRTRALKFFGGNKLIQTWWEDDLPWADFGRQKPDFERAVTKARYVMRTVTETDAELLAAMIDEAIEAPSSVPLGDE